MPPSEFIEGPIQFSYQNQQNQRMGLKIPSIDLIPLANNYTHKLRAYHPGHGVTFGEESQSPSPTQEAPIYSLDQWVTVYSARF